MEASGGVFNPNTAIGLSGTGDSPVWVVWHGRLKGATASRRAVWRPPLPAQACFQPENREERQKYRRLPSLLASIAGFQACLQVSRASKPACIWAGHRPAEQAWKPAILTLPRTRRRGRARERSRQAEGGKPKVQAEGVCKPKRSQRGQKKPKGSGRFLSFFKKRNSRSKRKTDKKRPDPFGLRPQREKLTKNVLTPLACAFGLRPLACPRHLKRQRLRCSAFSYR